jgi:outer membrane protein OmpA-like peptidoglycan-associated protein
MPLEAQTILLRGEAPDVYRVSEKHNFRKRENGVYVGAAYREVRGLLRRGESGDPWYAGRFYILEETKRAARSAAGRVDASVPARLEVDPLGAARAGSPGRFPTMRDFPALPGESVSTGANWQAAAERILDPDFSGAITPVQVYVDYVYLGPGEYKGFPGHFLKAAYAIRYRGGGTEGDPQLEEASGSHEANIFLPSEAGGSRMVSETFRESYRYRGGRELSLEGVILTVFEGAVPLDRPGTLTRIAEALKSAPSSPGAHGTQTPPPPPPALRPLPDIEVGGGDEGVTLTINNLNFRPDSAQLLASEAPRLDALAKALLALTDRSFLVAGHAADTGKPAGEKRLSLDRARAIAEALQKRGVPADRLVYEGRGATEPVAPNTDEAGRARNRRVQIIILE